MKIVEHCPMAARPPFLPPRRREVPLDVANRLRSWLRARAPGSDQQAPPRITEWVGADSRTDVHAVSFSFCDGAEPAAIVIFKRAAHVTSADVRRKTSKLGASAVRAATP